MVDETIAHADEVIARADALDAKLDNGVDTAIQALVAGEKRGVRNQRILGVLFGIVVMMLVIGALFVVRILDNTASIEATCNSLNRLNTRQIQLWDHVAEIQPIDQQTPEQQQQTVDFIKFVDDTFALFDCNQPKVLP